MTNVHKALKTLSPTDHSDFPADPSKLTLHLTTSLADAHILISSIPPPTLPDGITLPEPANAEIAALQNEWKPVKINPKDNPLGLNIFKLAAKDGKGTWFARRSVHTDIPFRRFKAGLQQEFQQPTVDETEGSRKPGPVRGIGKDVLVHHETCELGKAEIFHLSAQFPGPSAPRDFVEVCLTSSAHPEDVTAAAREEPGNDQGKNQQRPKQFTLISTPILNHPECEERSGYVRGYYESVEFIREIPENVQQLTRTQSTLNIPAADTLRPTPCRRGKTMSENGGEESAAAPKCAVDWVMITRSDPGGSVPKWMVERGTPSGIVKDAHKFIEWCRHATQLDDCPESSTAVIATEQEKGEQIRQDETLKAHTRRHLVERGAPAEAVLTPSHGKAELSPRINHDFEKPNTGILAGALNTVAAGMTSLAHSALYASSKDSTPPPSSPSVVDEDDSDPSPTLSRATTSDNILDVSDDETASVGTFATAESSQQATELPSRAASIASNTGSASKQTPEERALQQFLKEKQKLDEKFKKEESRRTSREKKIAEKHMKSMEKQERKYRRALEKANEKRRKEDEKAQKKLEREEYGRRGEIEELKRIVEALTKENIQLKERIEELEKLDDRHR
ncbi:hypothetical protein FN846DRAFT_1019196 [Sphaerosporella brunnea]|uniref:DUF3074 domain-containing protein n=1 Tax=Sphaerosporella brunnea TaxID=1250544 RepID=A0A5J5F849_9PEZI|nr:hypothetical protein FN846DRAFT_1019196 [Sphaerosporella brunnea]